MPKIPLTKHREDILKYKGEHNKYELYARVLKELLEKVRDMYAPMGFVEARAKKIESFSEKIIRKDKYKNPLIDMTDLCGARIITHFSKQVHTISAFIEENFEIDTLNSLDLRSRLQTSEFGYRSVHYVVTPRKSNILGVDIPDEIKNLKAEIQVRTLNEHIWADIIHDRIYKTSINITEEWKRESARLAAILEEADNAFAGISDTIDQLAVNYQATPSQEKLNNEIEILKVLIDLNEGIDNKDAEFRLKLARIFNLKGDWEKTIEFLKLVIDNKKANKFLYAALLREYGYALSSKDIFSKSKSYSEGIAKIEEAILIFRESSAKNKDLALSYKYLADVEKDALNNMNRAYSLLPENPYNFTSLLVLGFNAKEKPGDLILISSKMKETTNELKNHIKLGIEVTDAYLNIGKLLFLQSDFNSSADIYATLMRMVINDQIVFSKEVLIRELNYIEKISGFNPFHAQNIKGLLHLMLWIKYNKKNSREFLVKFRSKQNYEKNNVMIIAGKSAELNEKESKAYEPFIEEALRDFSGCVISGGTSSGIPGLTGTVAAIKRKNNSKKFTLTGYLPKGKTIDQDYDNMVETKASDFSVLEIITYWVDILFSNIKPEKVIVLGMDGGEISSLEYKIALSIGAKVCLIGKSGESAKEVAFDKDWNQLPNLYDIPDDPLTLWAMIIFEKPGVLVEDEINALAPLVHEFYRKQRLSDLKPEKETDINKYRVIMEWERLSASLRNSNIRQVAFMEHIFKRGGLKFVKSDHPQKFTIHNEYPTLKEMAKLEHARWNAERLLDGWKFGPKDVLNKRTPYLIPWDELDDDIKPFDYDPIIRFPELLLKIGYEVVEIN